MTTSTPSAEEIEKAINYAKQGAKKIALKLPMWIDKENLQGEALLAVAKAIQDFNPSRGSTFLSYCKYKVDRALLTEIHVQNRHGFRCLPPALHHADSRPGSLYVEEDGELVEHPVPDPAPPPFDQVVLRDLQAAVHQAVEKLERTDAVHGQVLRLRFLQELDQQATAEAMDYCFSRVWFLQRAALDYLRGHHSELAEHLTV